MWPGRVVVLAEIFDDHAGLGQGPELFAVEAPVPEAAVDALHKTVFQGMAGVM